jgi:hypothetical protein
MLTDDRFAAQLATAMRVETAQLRADPSLAAAVRRRHRRGAVVRGSLTAVPALAAAGVAATLVTGQLGRPGTAVGPVPGSRPSASFGGSPSPRTQATPRVLDAAYVIAQATAAIADAKDYVGVLTTPSGTTRWYLDAATNGFAEETRDASGRLLMATASMELPDGHRRALVVDYEHHVWADLIAGQAEGRSPGPTASATATNRVDAVTSFDPARILAAFQGDDLQLVGRQDVYGTATLHLRRTQTVAGSSQVDDLWVDSTSYLPLQLAVDGATWANVTWLPRTAATLAVFDLKPPPDFAHSPTNNPTPTAG